MDQRKETSLPASLISGRLEGLSVPDLLWNLCRRRSTGVLQLTSRGTTKKVYIDAGRIIFALSGDPVDRLGDLLLREGLITLDQLEGAIVKLSSGKRIGTILVEAGHLSGENLVRGVLNQVKGIVLGLFPLEEGEYAFVEGPLPTDEVVTLGMRTAEILLQGIRQIRSFNRIRRSVGAPSTRFRLDPAWHSVLDGLDIRDGERTLLQRLDEAGRQGAPIDTLCREVFLSNFEIYQALWAFMVLGVVEEVERSQDKLPGGAIAGRIERGTLPEVLVPLSREEVTGVLQMSRGPLERTLHIKEGQCIFATSNSVDDGLVAHLLRRGVISLSDREETARRLLSNKRVGTILLEMGVIDEDDLRTTVREQLSEIIFDTMRWDQGEFQFHRGELPTIEEITLKRTLEDLIFAGVRRVTSWPRVREGCGGLGARLVLLPEYLSILDKTTVGPEEWELISLLKAPKSVLEICRESMLGDFRSCQILWALRLLGAVGEAAIEVSVDSALGLLEATPVAAAPPAATLEEPEPAPIPVSDADESAEVISEPWRLAAERPATPPAPPAPAPEMPGEAIPLAIELAVPTDEPMPITIPIAAAPPEAEVPAESEAAAMIEPAATEPAPFELAVDAPGDATVLMAREAVEAALRRHDDGVPRFELGEPGTGLEDMRVDMPAIAPQAFELGEPVADEGEITDTEPIASSPPSAPEPVIDPNRTARLSREEVQSAIAPTPYTPPENLDGSIASFNARHVILFRALRAEIGAGAANFVRSCRGALDPAASEMFATAEIRADGSWDPEGLKRSVVDHRVADVDGAFERLLDGELQRLRAHLGDARVADLAGQLAAIP
jgi:hypothetical protein